MRRASDSVSSLSDLAEDLRLRLLTPVLEEGSEGIDGDGEDRRRVFVGRDLHQSLEVPKLQGRRISADDIGGVGKALRGLEFALGMDDFCTPFPFGFSLPR